MPNMTWRSRWLFGLVAAALGAAAIPASADAAFEKKIVDFGGAEMGSIAFPTASGSTAAGVAFEFEPNFSEAVFTEADITTISWQLDDSGAVVALDLRALQGDAPCRTAEQDGPCSNTTLSLRQDSWNSGGRGCPAPPPPDGAAFCFILASASVPISFVDVTPAYSCEGFKGALAKGPVAIKHKRLAWLRATLRDEDGKRLRRGDLPAPPVLVVSYQPPADAATRSLAPWPGIGGDGTAFVNVGSQWHLLLTLKDFADPGTYTVTMESGDPSAYRIDPNCEGVFVR